MDFIIVFFMSMDALLACFSLGAKKISISSGARFVIASVGTVCLILSLLFASVLSNILPEELFHIISCTALFLIALFCIFDAGFKQIASKLINNKRKLTLKLNGFYIMMEICSDTSKADKDHSGILSPFEALALSVPLSIDSLLTGLSLNTSNALSLVIFSFVCGLLATFIGQIMGKRLLKSQGDGAAVYGGFVLMLIAGFKMVWG